MNKKFIITISLCLLAIAATVYFLFFHSSDYDAADSSADSNSSSASSSTTTTATTVSKFPLKSGSKGAEVKKLQSKMNEWMAYYYLTLPAKPSYSQLSVDGIFGPKTLSFVKIIFVQNQVTETQYNEFLTKSWGSPGKTTQELNSIWDYWFQFN